MTRGLAASENLRSATIGVIGAGRLGSALAAALTAAGIGPVEVGSRRPETVGVTAEGVVDRCDLVFVTVPDAAIPAIARSLPWREGQAVVHCSGALGLDALAAAAAKGALTGCLHPLQTFPAGGDLAQAPTLFRGVTCGIESGEASLRARLEMIATSLGARPIRLDGIDRALYHAAAVLVSNDVVALMAAATRIWESSGLPAGSAREALTPLLLAAADNVRRLPLAQALTGPIARGDVATVEGHLHALEVEPELRELYRRLALELARLDLGHSASLAADLRRTLG